MFLKQIYANMQALAKTTSHYISNHWEDIKVILYSLFAFLNVDLDIIHIILWLMLIDTCVGVIKAIVVDKMRFTFRTFYIGIMSKFVLLLIPMTLALVALGVGYNLVVIVDATLRLLVLSEGISIITNVISIKDNKILTNRDYLSIILRWVRQKLISLFDTVVDKNKTPEK